MHANFKLQIFDVSIPSYPKIFENEIMIFNMENRYITPSPLPLSSLYVYKYANVRSEFLKNLDKNLLTRRNQLKILSALTVHARCNTVPELINRDSRRTKTGLIKLSIYFLYIVQP